MAGMEKKEGRGAADGGVQGAACTYGILEVSEEKIQHKRLARTERPCHNNAHTPSNTHTTVVLEADKAG